MQTTFETNPPTSRTRTHRLLAVLGAVAAALAGWVLVVPVAGAELAARQGGQDQPVGPAAVAIAALIAGLAAWALLATLERLLARPRPVWTVLALVVLALSLAGPLGGGVDTVSKLTLTGMHLAVGAVLIPALRRGTGRG